MQTPTNIAMSTESAHLVTIWEELRNPEKIEEDTVALVHVIGLLSVETRHARQHAAASLAASDQAAAEDLLSEAIRLLRIASSWSSLADRMAEAGFGYRLALRAQTAKTAARPNSPGE